VPVQAWRAALCRAALRADVRRSSPSRPHSPRRAQSEVLLSNTEGLSEENQTQLSNLLFDLKQQAMREQDVNSGWKRLRQSKTFQKHTDDRQDVLTSPLAQRQGDVASSPLAPAEELDLESNALAQWNQIRRLKSVKSLSKSSSLARLLEEQSEASGASKAPGGAEWDGDDGVYKDADAFRRQKSSKWNKARALVKVNALIERKNQSSDDETDEAAQSPIKEEPAVQDDSYGIKIPKNVMEREMLRQDKERHLGHAARQAQNLRMKKLHTIHKHGHHGPLVEYGSRFDWHDLCVAASTFAFKGFCTTQPDHDSANTHGRDNPPDRAAETPSPTKKKKNRFRWKLGTGDEVSDHDTDQHVAAPQSLPPVVPRSRASGEKEGGDGGAAGASPFKKAASLGALGNKMGWLLQSRQASLK